jgi:hypothetical protein
MMPDLLPLTTVPICFLNNDSLLKRVAHRNYRCVSAVLRRATVNFVMSVRPSVRLSVCLSVRMEQLGSLSTDFHEICYLNIL